MHDCPECQQACDCDGEDIWWEAGFGVEECTHECEEEEEDES